MQVHFWWPCFKPRLAICVYDAEDVFEWLRIWQSTILLKCGNTVPLKKVGKLGNLSLDLRRESSWFWVADRLGLLEGGLTMFEDIDSDEQSVATTRQGFMRILAFFLWDSEDKKEVLVSFHFTAWCLQAIVRQLCIAACIGHWIWRSRWPFHSSRQSALSINCHSFIILYFFFL